MKVLYMTTLILFLPLFGSLFYIYSNQEQEQQVELIEELVAPISITLDTVQTTASSAIVVSLNTNAVLYQKQSNKLLPLASLTKLVTAKVAEDSSSDQKIIIQKMSDQSYGDPVLGDGQYWNKEDLIAYTLITSSNDGAHTLSKSTRNPYFIDSMNTLASTIGLTSTRFYNETGLDNDEAGIPGSKGTAKDISTLLSYLVKNNLALYEKTKYSNSRISSPSGTVSAKNTNDITNRITGLLLSKTGYTDTAGGNLAVVADMGLNEPTAFVVLHSSKEDRFKDVLALQENYFAQIRDSMR